MIVIDSSALIAILKREPEADDFLGVIAATNSCLLSATSYLETSLVLAGKSGNAENWVALDALIARAAIMIVPQDEEQACAAREAFLQYGKGRHKAALNFGDCASYALAKVRALPLLFKGEDFPHTDMIAAG